MSASDAPRLRPVDLARAASISTQQVRRYEMWGVIPGAARTASGYRVYTPRHLDAVRTARVLMRGYAWRDAVRVMQLVHAGRADAAFAMADASHARVHLLRRATRETLDALRAVASSEPRVERGRGGLRIAEAAALVGVRPSALRHWEDERLLQPRRDPYNGYRVYDSDELRRLRVVALLRQAGYRFDAVRQIVAELTGGSVDHAVAAAERRLADLDQASRRCAEATAALHAYAARLDGSGTWSAQ